MKRKGKTERIAKTYTPIKLSKTAGRNSILVGISNS